MPDRPQKLDLRAPELFINREYSWLEFNNRVLEEAQDKSNPLCERLKFLAIVSSNLDEFYMVRVSGLTALLELGLMPDDPAGLSPAEQLSGVSKRVHKMVYEQYNCYNRSVVRALRTDGGVDLVSAGELTEDERTFTERYFNTTLFPILTPMAIDQSRPFPFLRNRSLNILLELEKRDSAESPRYAVVQLPPVVPRYCEVSSGRFILLEEIIQTFIYRLFNGNKVLSSYCFRITRDSDLEFDEEDTADLRSEIEKSIKKRMWGAPVRLEIEKAMRKPMRKFLEKTLELDDLNVYEIIGPLDLTFLMSFVSKCPAYLKLAPINPVRPPAFSVPGVSVFDAIRAGDILVHHPYESFDAVLDFVRTAAWDQNVLAIKQTLYRVSGDSPIVKSLMEAAENGKAVTVLVELKARFDEENNLLWARRLEQSGCHVIYGLVGYKTHCKMCLVVRREDDGIHRYVHLSTGNYNDSTAKLYTDLGFFTCKETYCADASALFNVLTGYSLYNRYNKFIAAPDGLRQAIIGHIENEAKNAVLGRPAGITAKMNALVDPEVIAALYKAAMAGVSIRLIVRGVCCLRPGIPGISESITVVSVVGRYLEHSRIFRFENGGNPVTLLSSADWMQRNFDRRVEIAFPVEDPVLKERLDQILETILSDTIKLRTLMTDGSYIRVDRRGRESVQSQLLFHESLFNPS